VIDILAGNGTGDPAEAKAQAEMLRHECTPDGTAKLPATLTMVRKRAPETVAQKGIEP
jgi:hypothetical protein